MWHSRLPRLFTFTFFLCLLYVVPHVYLKVQTATIGEAPVSPHEAFLVEKFLGNPLITREAKKM